MPPPGSSSSGLSGSSSSGLSGSSSSGIADEAAEVPHPLLFVPGSACVSSLTHIPCPALQERAPNHPATDDGGEHHPAGRGERHPAGRGVLATPSSQAAACFPPALAVASSRT